MLTCYVRPGAAQVAPAVNSPTALLPARARTQHPSHPASQGPRYRRIVALHFSRARHRPPLSTEHVLPTNLSARTVRRAASRLTADRRAISPERGCIYLGDQRKLSAREYIKPLGWILGGLRAGSPPGDSISREAEPFVRRPLSGAGSVGERFGWGRVAARH